MALHNTLLPCCVKMCLYSLHGTSELSCFSESQLKHDIKLQTLLLLPCLAACMYLYPLPACLVSFCCLPFQKAASSLHAVLPPSSCMVFCTAFLHSSHLISKGRRLWLFEKVIKMAVHQCPCSQQNILLLAHLLHAHTHRWDRALRGKFLIMLLKRLCEKEGNSGHLFRL